MDANFCKSLGRGAYGEVFRAKWQGVTVAVKKLSAENQGDKEAIEDLRREASILATLKHPNIVLQYGACTRKLPLQLVLEFMPGGSVHRLLHKDLREISLTRKLFLMKQVAQVRCLGVLQLLVA
eukprot:scaffold412_cov388-Prasinococcus_capsulatus_cf.AAC.50